MLDKNIVWSERYRPTTIDEVILPERYKKVFRGFVKTGKIPHLLLAGPSGIGKTTIARVLAKELNYDVLEINASLDRNIDTLRNEIQSFASTFSLEGKRKCVILDEADYLNATTTQPALRNFIQTYGSNCSFVFTANKKQRLMQPLHSRCSVIDFRIAKEEKKEIALALLKRIEYILSTEQVEFSRNVLVEFIKKYFPDFRRTINELQKFDKIDVGVLANVSDESMKELVEALSSQNFPKMREWVAKSDIEFSDLVTMFYQASTRYLEEASVPQLVLTLNKYQYQHSFVADPEINTVAMLTEIMADCRFKKG